MGTDGPGEQEREQSETAWAPGCSSRHAAALSASGNGKRNTFSGCEDDAGGLRHLWRDPANVGSKSMA